MSKQATAEKAKDETAPATTPAAEAPKSTAVATAAPAQVPANVDLGVLEQDAGAGTQNVTATDLQTPIIFILQSNSPQCKKSDPKYIKEAGEGKLMNNVSGEIYDGEKGIKVIPCYFEKVFIEWKPNRGGLVAIHPASTPLRDQVKMVENKEGKQVPTLPNGNQLSETNQHYVLILKDDGTVEPAVIAMASSALKASRIWNTLMKKVQVQGKSGPFNPASYYSVFLLKTVVRQKDQNTWFSWSAERVGDVPNMNVYNAGKAFEQAVAGGQVRVKLDDNAQGEQHEPGAREDDEQIPFN